MMPSGAVLSSTEIQRRYRAKIKPEMGGDWKAGISPINRVKCKKFTKSTIKAAFAHFGDLYDKSLEIRLRRHLYRNLEGAFSSEEEVLSPHYQRWKGTWENFRSRATDLKLNDGVFNELHRSDLHLQEKRLHEITLNDIQPICSILFALSDAKRTTKLPSIMAVSRFLHFWNPRLFVHVERCTMQHWVLEHNWVKHPVKHIATAIADEFLDEEKTTTGFQPWLATYIALLLWCARLLRNNPGIHEAFRNFNEERILDPDLRNEINSYEALAIEWFLLGATHLPPS